ncbi:MAG: helix-turn-helix transcriptional regulator [Clostridia bacterium]|nr:helix-turn-helix transcriptional regulator [Clostridia bacterium]MBN2882467.1 helix-turn-helix transcriptional regulator [Clostridia bacterium]
MKINRKQNEEYAELLKALAHPDRLCIVRNLIILGGTTVSYMQNCMNQPQSTLSQHIAKLRTLKVITGTRQGKEIYYEVTNETAKKIISALYDKK